MPTLMQDADVLLRGLASQQNLSFTAPYPQLEPRPPNPPLPANGLESTE